MIPMKTRKANAKKIVFIKTSLNLIIQKEWKSRKGAKMTASVILQLVIPVLVFIGIVIAGGSYKEKKEKIGAKNEIRYRSSQANSN